MTKLMLMPNEKKFDYETDAFLIGIEGLSVNMPIYFTLEEVKKIKTDKELFVCLNKNMHKDDLCILENILIELNSLSIKGVFFYDIGVFNIAKRLNLNFELILAQEHMNTNYESINYWYNLGINYVQLSSEISVNEIKVISENTKCKLIVPLFGYQPMFVSRRHLVKNYLDFFDLSDDSKVNYIEKEGKVYPIVDENVTSVYTNAYMNGINEFLELGEKIDYALINGFLIDSDSIKKIINLFKTVDINNVDEYNKKISNILNNTDTFFLHKETIYKVK